MRFLMFALAFAMFLLAAVSCSPEPEYACLAAPEVATPDVAAATFRVAEADPWWMRVPAGHTGYRACRRMWIVVDAGGGDLRGGGPIWYEIYAPGDPIIMPDRQQQQVHEMVVYGDCVPWVQPGVGRD